MKIEITIDPQGQITVETQGFAGASCTDATRQLEQALGQKLSDQHTGEFYQQLPVQQAQQTQS